MNKGDTVNFSDEYKQTISRKDDFLNYMKDHDFTISDTFGDKVKLQGMAMWGFVSADNFTVKGLGVKKIARPSNEKSGFWIKPRCCVLGEGCKGKMHVHENDEEACREKLLNNGWILNENNEWVCFSCEH